jgi:hypothetical protein
MLKKLLIGCIILLLLFTSAPIINGYNNKIIRSNNFNSIKEEYCLNKSNNHSISRLIKTEDKCSEIWNRTYGGLKDDFGWFVKQTKDGGYIITGSTISNDKRYSDLWLIKTDQFGKLKWDKIFGGDDIDIGKTVAQTSDGGYILAGITNSIEGTNRDILLIKTNSLGNIEWNRILSGIRNEDDPYVQPTTDGGYIIICASNSFGSGRYDFWLIKTDENGIIEWNKTFGGYHDDNGKTVQQTSDGGYILGGSTKSFGSGKYDFWLIKTDEKGNELWNKTYGAEKDENIWSIQQTRDKGIIISGCTSSYGNGGYDFWLLKTDEQGNELWNQTFGGINDDYSSFVRQTNDNGYILIGQTYSYGRGKNDIWLIKTNCNGSIYWEKTYGGINSDYGWCVDQTSDYGYIFTGCTNSFNNESFDLWLVKTPSDNYISLDVEIFGGNSLYVEVNNTGLNTLFNVNWSISITNGIILSQRYSQGIIDVLPYGITKRIYCHSIYGIGKIIITFNIGEISKIKKGLVIVNKIFIN